MHAHVVRALKCMCVFVFPINVCVFPQTLMDPLVEKGSEGLQVLQLWREKVFKLCVQLRSKDIEIRGEKENLISKV